MLDNNNNNNNNTNNCDNYDRPLITTMRNYIVKYTIIIKNKNKCQGIIIIIE